MLEAAGYLKSIVALRNEKGSYNDFHIVVPL